MVALRAEVEAGPFGPVFHVKDGDWRAAIEILKQRRTGEVPAALTHPKVPRISLIWGDEGIGPGTGAGLAKIIRRHPDILDDLQGRLTAATGVISESPNRIGLASARDLFVISRDAHGAPHDGWLLTAYEAQGGDGRSMGRAASLPEGSSPSASLRNQDTLTGAADQDGSPADLQSDAELDTALAAARAELSGEGDFEVDVDGTRASDLLAGLDEDIELQAVIDACTLGGGTA